MCVTYKNVFMPNNHPKKTKFSVQCHDAYFLNSGSEHEIVPLKLVSGAGWWGSQSKTLSYCGEKALNRQTDRSDLVKYIHKVYCTEDNDTYFQCGPQSLILLGAIITFLYQFLVCQEYNILPTVHGVFYNHVLFTLILVYVSTVSYGLAGMQHSVGAI